MTTVANPAVFSADDMEIAVRAVARFIVDLTRREPISASSFEQMMENYPPEMRQMNEDLVRAVLRAAHAVPARSLATFTWDVVKVHEMEKVGHATQAAKGPAILTSIPQSATPLAPGTVARYQKHIRVRVIQSYAYTTRVSLGHAKGARLVWTYELEPEGLGLARCPECRGVTSHKMDCSEGRK